MKNYVRPSALLSRFDAEEIMAVSGLLNAKVTDAEEVRNSEVYYDYLSDSNNTAADNGYVEFYW